MADIRIFDLVTQLNPSTNDFLPITNGANTNKVPINALPVNYNNLINKPVIPAAQQQTDWNATSGITSIANKPSFATVASTGSYLNLNNLPFTVQAHCHFSVTGYTVSYLGGTTNIQSVVVNAPRSRGAQSATINMTSNVDLNGVGMCVAYFQQSEIDTQSDRMRVFSSTCALISGRSWKVTAIAATGGNEVDGGPRVQKSTHWASCQSLSFFYFVDL